MAIILTQAETEALETVCNLAEDLVDRSYEGEELKDPSVKKWVERQTRMIEVVRNLKERG